MMKIRPFEIEDQTDGIELWRACALVVPRQAQESKNGHPQLSRFKPQPVVPAEFPKN